MRLVSFIEKWISEHGSAATLRDHVALLQEEKSGLEAKVRSLEKQVAELTSERDAAQSEAKQLKDRIDILNRRKKYGSGPDGKLHEITSEQVAEGDD